MAGNQVRPYGLQLELGKGHGVSAKEGEQWLLAGQVCLHWQKLCALRIAYKTPWYQNCIWNSQSNFNQEQWR